ncbi:adenylate/guanylate cyclase domain-containing protein [Shimia sp. R9_1]|uniref:adenylate/guanylate cyclase domain-containing protein n=1 Tax=unclassified Shimia TaxID=2630038 RepID=UPI001AD988B0|nr:MULTISPECIES: adenylate/guanylate cyclase domain-containing protein [unclassified Shimia]MBO9398542.1 adenylate/guanylate cyclase domain-containing protein [Shimia sp. R9_2]MBO9409378.1 adenylate/guanylate cyclase domain-containing protein [Shimia sp. R9_1]
MTIEAINEQLLRAIGVGVALVGRSDLKFLFYNNTFEEWFEDRLETDELLKVFEDLNTEELHAALDDAGQYTAEIRHRKKRRQLVIAADFTSATDGDQELIVLVCQNITRIRELESMIDSYSMMVERNTREIKREKEQVEKLLLNIMPRSVYEEYKAFGVVTPQLYDPVSVLMLDFVGFTDMVASADPSVTVTELNDIYSAFDRIGEQFGCERIKTIGDAYITVAGLPDPTPDHARAVANAAIRFVRYLERRNTSHPNQWRCRIGIASGAVVGSVVGIQKYVYDIFGPAVNLATRLQEFAEPMQISVQDEVAATLKDQFDLQALGAKDIRGFDRQEVWRLLDVGIEKKLAGS